MRRRPHVLFACAAVAAGCSRPPPEPKHAERPDPGREPAARSSSEKASEPALQRGWEDFDASRYARAKAAFSEARDAHPAEASEGLARVYLMTGRYDRAAEMPGLDERSEGAWIRAEALRRMGRLDEAIETLKGVVDRPAARRARLLLGEVLLEEGREADAAPYLMSLIEDYNSDRIGKDDAFSLAMVGRAAHLLKSPHDANDAFNEAERAAEANAQTLLWRGELFLENYDQGHAEEVVREVLAKAPHHPEALVLLARVKLAQSLDFEAADKLTTEALDQNPKLAGAFFVRAGIALRDMELERADEHIDAGLEYNPRNLELLSLRAALRFLADDERGFDAAKKAVLEKNRRYAHLFHIIGEYAEWEHRYGEIVEIMREALLTDPDDPKVRAQLGFNLIRSGEEDAGVRSLRRAFANDPFNVRVYNTLNLYEKEIPEHYESVQRGRFLIRYDKTERPILDRYVPDLLEKAWQKMVRHYGFVPEGPVGIELYPEREHFAVRTSGLPQTFIQGVCFGRTLAAMSPKKESFNFGMTVWHELAHVFHIQLSRSRVPRWLTEGLAEFETLDERSEWRREHDADLYRALREGRIPEVASMNRAFSHARDMDDMATAYYAATQIAVMLSERYGMEGVRRMIELYGEGHRTAEVVDEALGTTPEAIDRAFREYLRDRLSRYDAQFVPIERVGDIDDVARQAQAEPDNADAQARYALALLSEGEAGEAKAALDRALALDPEHGQALWLLARQALATKRVKRAEEALSRLVAAGHDGYDVQMALAAIYSATKRPAKKKEALEAAHHFDPSQEEPLAELVAVAAREGDAGAELEALRKLAAIDQHDPRVYRKLMEKLLSRGEIEEAVEVGESAIYVDMEGLRTHVLYAEALSRSGNRAAAKFELETAVLCPGRPNALADAHARLAELLADLGRRAEAKKHADEARSLDPSNARLGGLKL